METKTWHNIEETQLTGRIRLAAQSTLTLTIDKSGNFIYTDMGISEVWQSFCSQAGISEK